MKNTSTYRVWGLIALLVLLSPLAVSAQKSAKAQGPYHSVEIQVKDLSNDQVIGTIEPGGTFTLTEGQRVRLIMTAIHSGNGKGSYYPETQFTETEPGRGWVRVTRTNAENSSATLEVVRPGASNRDRTETLRYQITENVGIPNNLRQGTVNIRVEPLSAAGSAPAPYTSDGSARGLTNVLYRAILMRDMDPSGQPYVDRIARGGYAELMKIADEIARSEESRFQVYTRGETITQEQRLTALYRNLLNMNANQVDREQWSNDLRRLEEGKIADVVRDMVHSDRFQDVHDLSGERTAIRY